MKMWCDHPLPKNQFLHSLDCEFAVSKQSQLLFTTNCLMFCSHLTRLSMCNFMKQNRFRRCFVTHHFIFAEGCFFQTFFHIDLWPTTVSSGCDFVGEINRFRNQTSLKALQTTKDSLHDGRPHTTETFLWVIVMLLLMSLGLVQFRC